MDYGKSITFLVYNCPCILSGHVTVTSFLVFLLQCCLSVYSPQCLSCHACALKSPVNLSIEWKEATSVYYKPLQCCCNVVYMHKHPYSICTYGSCLLSQKTRSHRVHVQRQNCPLLCAVCLINKNNQWGRRRVAQEYISRTICFVFVHL